MSGATHKLTLKKKYDFSHSQRLICNIMIKPAMYSNENADRKGFHISNISVSFRKDIHDLDGIHGYWRSTAAVTLIVHNNHEEVAAGNLLYDKRSAAQTQTGVKVL